MLEVGVTRLLLEINCQAKAIEDEIISSAVGTKVPASYFEKQSNHH